MSTALVAAPAQALMENTRALAETLDLFRKMAEANCMPSSMKPAEAMLCASLGASYGWNPIQSCQRFHVVKGSVVMKADVMVGIAKAHPACRFFTCAETTTERATYITHREGSPSPESVTFTMEDARQAGVLSNGTWKKYPAQMLRARASAALVRMVYPDAIAGIYTPDEMGRPDVGFEAEGVVEAEFTEEPQQPMRRQSSPPRRVEGDADAGGGYEPNDGPQGYEGLVYFIEHLDARAAFNAYLKAKENEAATPQTLDSIRSWAVAKKFDEQQELISAALPDDPITHESVWATIKRHLGAALGRPPVAAELSALRSRIRWADESLGERDHALACCLLAARCVRKPETLRLRLGLEVAS